MKRKGKREEEVEKEEWKDGYERDKIRRMERRSRTRRGKKRSETARKKGEEGGLIGGVAMNKYSRSRRSQVKR